jgi:hypothetical protein
MHKKHEKEELSEDNVLYIGVKQGENRTPKIISKWLCVCQLAQNSVCERVEQVSCGYTTLQRRSHLCIPRNETTRSRSQFPHSWFCERFIYSHGRSFSMNVGVRNKATQFHFWEYLFRIFGTISLQCTVLPDSEST